MTVEEMRVVDSTVENHKFPVGMRVLAVDDDPTCLKLLETLLRRCQYKVTTTSQAKIALKMLRENKNRFDLVISDVHMPDMDGFKLLELVGLEMDLPVIMLSAYSDTDLVMKGISHGACDYLVKPIRLEELKNIWQHVIRKNKSNPNPNPNLNHQTKSIPPIPTTGFEHIDQQKLNRKRKEEEDEGGHGNENENENDNDNDNDVDDSTTQKKPRVVWSIELHRKFVSAVNHLGIEKAFPKRILDLMNVQGLTRENVASHLQKYRLYLKRISSVTNQQQGNMVGAFGSYMRTNSLDGLGDFQARVVSGSLLSSSSSSSSAGGMFGRLNRPVSGINLLHHHHNNNNNANNMMMNTKHSVRDIGKFQPVVLTPAHLEPNKFTVDGQTSFSTGTVNVNNNRLLLQNPRIPQMGQLDSKPLKGIDGSFLDHGTFQISNTLPNHSTVSESYDQLVYNGAHMIRPPTVAYSHCQVPNQRWGQNEAMQSSKNTNHHIVSRDVFDNSYNNNSLIQKSDQDLLIFEQPKQVTVSSHNGYDALEDLITDVIKQEGCQLMEGDFGLDCFPFDSSL